MKSITINGYTDSETEAALLNYFDRGHIPLKVNRPLIQQARVCSDSNPEALRRYVKSGILHY